MVTTLGTGSSVGLPANTDGRVDGYYLSTLDDATMAATDNVAHWDVAVYPGLETVEARLENPSTRVADIFINVTYGTQTLLSADGLATDGWQLLDGSDTEVNYAFINAFADTALGTPDGGSDIADYAGEPSISANPVGDGSSPMRLVVPAPAESGGTIRLLLRTSVQDASRISARLVELSSTEGGEPIFSSIQLTESADSSAAGAEPTVVRGSFVVRPAAGDQLQITLYNLSTADHSAPFGGFISVNVVVGGIRQLLGVDDWSVAERSIVSVESSDIGVSLPSDPEGPAPQTPRVWVDDDPANPVSELTFTYVFGGRNLASPRSDRVDNFDSGRSAVVPPPPQRGGTPFTGRVLPKCLGRVRVLQHQETSSWPVYIEQNTATASSALVETCPDLFNYDGTTGGVCTDTQVTRPLYGILPRDELDMECVANPADSGTVWPGFNALVTVEDMASFTSEGGPAWFVFETTSGARDSPDTLATIPSSDFNGDLPGSWRTLPFPTSLLGGTSEMAHDDFSWNTQVDAGSASANGEAQTFVYRVPYVSRATTLVAQACVSCGLTTCTTSSVCETLLEMATTRGYGVLIGLVMDLSGSEAQATDTGGSLRTTLESLSESFIGLVLDVSASSFLSGPDPVNRDRLNTVLAELVPATSSTNGRLDTLPFGLRMSDNDCTRIFGAGTDLYSLEAAYSRLALGLLWVDHLADLDTDNNPYITPTTYSTTICGFPIENVFGREVIGASSGTAVDYDFGLATPPSKLLLRGPFGLEESYPGRALQQLFGPELFSAGYGVQLRGEFALTSPALTCLFGSTSASLESRALFFECIVSPAEYSDPAVPSCREQLEAVNAIPYKGAAHPVVSVPSFNTLWAFRTTLISNLLTNLFNPSFEFGRLWFNTTSTTSAGTVDAWAEHFFAEFGHSVDPDNPPPLGLIMNTRDCINGGPFNLYDRLEVASTDLLLWAATPLEGGAEGFEDQATIRSGTTGSRCGFSSARTIVPTGGSRASDEAVSIVDFDTTSLLTASSPRPLVLGSYGACAGLDGDAAVFPYHLTFEPPATLLFEPPDPLGKLDPDLPTTMPWPIGRGGVVSGEGDTANAPACLGELSATEWIVDCPRTAIGGACSDMVGALSAVIPPGLPLEVRVTVDLSNNFFDEVSRILSQLLGDPADAAPRLITLLWLRLDSDQLSELTGEAFTTFLGELTAQLYSELLTSADNVADEGGLADSPVLPIGFSFDVSECAPGATGSLSLFNLRAYCPEYQTDCLLWHTTATYPSGYLCGFTQADMFLAEPEAVGNSDSGTTTCDEAVAGGVFGSTTNFRLRDLEVELPSDGVEVVGDTGTGGLVVRASELDDTTGAPFSPNQCSGADPFLPDLSLYFAGCIVCSGSTCTTEAGCLAALVQVIDFALVRDPAVDPVLHVSLGVTLDPAGSLADQGEGARGVVTSLTASVPGLNLNYLVIELEGSPGWAIPTNGTDTATPAQNVAGVEAFLNALLLGSRGPIGPIPYRVSYLLSRTLCATGGAFQAVNLSTVCSRVYPQCVVRPLWEAIADGASGGTLIRVPSICGFTGDVFGGKLQAFTGGTDPVTTCGLTAPGTARVRSAFFTALPSLAWPLPRAVSVASSVVPSPVVLACLSSSDTGLRSLSLLHACDLDATCRAMLEAYGATYPAQPVITLSATPGSPITPTPDKILAFLGMYPSLPVGRVWFAVHPSNIDSDVSRAELELQLRDFFQSLRHGSNQGWQAGIQVGPDLCSGSTSILADFDLFSLCTEVTRYNRFSDGGVTDDESAAFELSEACAVWLTSSGSVSAFSTTFCGFGPERVAYRALDLEVALDSATPTSCPSPAIDLTVILADPNYLLVNPAFLPAASPTLTDSVSQQILARPIVHHGVVVSPSALANDSSVLSALSGDGCRFFEAVVVAPCLTCSGTECTLTSECLSGVETLREQGYIPSLVVVPSPTDVGSAEAQGASARAALEAAGGSLRIAQVVLDLESSTGWSTGGGSETGAINIELLASFLSGLVSSEPTLSHRVPLAFRISLQTCRNRFAGEDLFAVCTAQNALCVPGLYWAALEDGRSEALLDDMPVFCGFEPLATTFKEVDGAVPSSCAVGDRVLLGVRGAAVSGQLTTWPIVESVADVGPPTEGSACHVPGQPTSSLLAASLMGSLLVLVAMMLGGGV